MTREELAVVRTHLANERTLLAYIRTGLAFLAGGIGAVHFVPSLSGSLFGWSLIGTGTAVIILGVVRFFICRSQITKAYA
jgi:putative membrane protein